MSLKIDRENLGAARPVGTAVNGSGSGNGNGMNSKRNMLAYDRSSTVGGFDLPRIAESAARHRRRRAGPRPNGNRPCVGRGRARRADGDSADRLRRGQPARHVPCAPHRHRHIDSAGTAVHRGGRFRPLVRRWRRHLAGHGGVRLRHRRRQRSCAGDRETRLCRPCRDGDRRLLRLHHRRQRHSRIAVRAARADVGRMARVARLLERAAAGRRRAVGVAYPAQSQDRRRVGRRTELAFRPIRTFPIVAWRVRPCSAPSDDVVRDGLHGTAIVRLLHHVQLDAVHLGVHRLRRLHRRRASVHLPRHRHFLRPAHSETHERARQPGLRGAYRKRPHVHRRPRHAAAAASHAGMGVRRRLRARRVPGGGARIDRVARP